MLVNTSLTLRAQSAFKTEHLSTRDGLSHRWVYHIMQDSRGFIWLSTYDGLNRYDGNGFVAYRPTDQGPYPSGANRVQMAVEQSDGSFLVSTEYRMFRFDPLRERFDTIPYDDPETGKILVLPEKEGAPFIMGHSSLWSQAKRPIFIYQREARGKLGKIAAIQPPAAVQLYPVACRNGVVWFWDFAGNYHRFDLHRHQMTTLSVAGTASVPVDAGGRLWLPDNQRLRAYSLPRHETPTTWTAFTLEAGRVWLYSEDQRAFFRFDLDNGQLEKIVIGLPMTDIGKSPAYWSGIPNHFVDKDGVIWFGYFQGVRKIVRSLGMFRHHLAKPPTPGEVPPVSVSARQMVEDAAGRIYVRDNFHGLYQIDPRNKKAGRLMLPTFADRSGARPAEAWQQVSSMCNDPDGAVWIRTFAGLLKCDTAGNYRYYDPFNNRVVDNGYALFDDGLGRLWLPSGDSIYIFDKGSGAIRRLPHLLGYELAYGVMLAGEQSLWGFTDTGLVRINTLDETVQYIKLYDNLRDQRGLVAHRGWLWLATSKGLVKMDPNTFKHTTFDRAQGLPGNFVYSLLADGDYLWLGTSDGLCRFEINTGAVKNFYLEDGLSHYEFNSPSVLKAGDGQIYMGTLNGVNAFYPSDLARKTTVPSHIHWTKFSYYDSRKDSLLFLNFDRLNDPAPLIIPPSVRSFTFYLALDNYIETGKNQYAWRMEGLDQDWNYVGNQAFAVYNQLPPGNYTFRAKAADPFGNWSANELAIPLKVLRPWYQRWWAYALLAGLLAGLIVFLYRFQLKRRLDRAETRRLQEMDEVKTRLYTNITHEFRTPLTVILGLTEHLKSQIDERYQGTLDTIRRNGRNLLSLINQMLDLSKLESGAMPLHMVQGDVVNYSRYILESFHSYAESKGIKLGFHSNTDHFYMDHDPEKWLHMLSNLIGNALKFTPRGGRIQLSLTAPEEQAPATRADGRRREALSGKHFQLAVSDTGIGISPEKLPHIFDRFYQTEATEAEGTGIGLALVRELVKLMRGDIEVQSRPGEGTTFILSLPVIRSQPPPLIVPAREELSMEAGPEPRAVDGNGATTDERPLLLIIEDNLDVIQYLCACVEEDYQLAIAYNGRQGIEKAIELVPDIIISDVMMPEKDGFEVCRTLKRDERTSHIPIILLTAKADVASRIAGLERGADAYLAKPFDRKELLVHLRKLIELRKALQRHFSKTMPLLTSPIQHEPNRDVQIEDAFLQKVKAVIEAHLSDAEFNTDQLCHQLHMSYTQLYRKVKALTDQSIAVFIRGVRLQKGYELLRTTDLTVSEIAYDVGFTDPAYFTRTFSQQFGKSPTELRT